MKTLTNTLLKSALIAIVLFLSLPALQASAKMVTVTHGMLNTEIKRIIVKGNTKVIVVQSNRDYITMDDLDLEKVVLHQVGPTLTITSSAPDPAVVYVHVKNIYRIIASDQAVVKTLGTFHTKNLQLIVKNDARVRIKASTESLYTVVNDNASLELRGNTALHIAETDGIGTLKTEKFAALKTETKEPLIKSLVMNSHRVDSLSNATRTNSAIK